MFVLDELQACLNEPWTVAVKRTGHGWEASVSGDDPVVDTCWEDGDTAEDAVRRLVSFLVMGVSPRLSDRNVSVDDPLVVRQQIMWRSMTGPERPRLSFLYERLRGEYTTRLIAAAERARWIAEGVTETERECARCQHQTRVPATDERWVCSECGMPNGADAPMWPVRGLGVAGAADSPCV